jgi:GNAT superfamily N-acetyltransferase
MEVVLRPGPCEAGCVSSSLEIRPARLDDARELAEVHIRAWQAAYRGMMPDDFLDGLDVSRRERGWRRMLAAEPPGYGVLVPVLDGRVVGFAWTGPEREDEDGLGAGGSAEPGRDGELWAINLHPDVWGRGVGSALLRAAHATLTERGHGDAVLWVLPGNTRARRFYEHHGWVPDGTERSVDVASGVPVTELRYRVALAPGR